MKNGSIFKEDTKGKEECQKDNKEKIKWHLN